LEEKAHLLRKKPFLAKKSLLGRKTQILLPEWKKMENEPRIPIKDTVFYRCKWPCAFCRVLERKSGNYALFRKICLCAQKRFWREKYSFSEKCKMEEMEPKTPKKHWFHKLLSDGAGNGIPDTKKDDFLEKSHFSQKRKFPKCCALFAKSAQNRFWGVRNSVHPLKQRPNQHFWEVILL
jgi:hypothetical protein